MVSTELLDCPLEADDDVVGFGRGFRNCWRRRALGGGAEAAMTAFIRALPRLYDELNSSHLCTHGASRQALAVGYCDRQFVSAVRVSRPQPPCVREWSCG